MSKDKEIRFHCPECSNIDVLYRNVFPHVDHTCSVCGKVNWRMQPTQYESINTLAPDISHLETASKNINKWPKWKKELAGLPVKETTFTVEALYIKSFEELADELIKRKCKPDDNGDWFDPEGNKVLSRNVLADTGKICEENLPDWATEFKEIEADIDFVVTET